MVFHAHSRRLPLALAALLLLPGLARADGSANRPASAVANPSGSVEAVAPQRKLFLWTVKGKSGGEVHLVGSVHLADPSFYPLPEALESRFEAAEVVVVEADVEGPEAANTQGIVLSAGMLTDGSSLKDHLPAKTYAAVSAAAADAGFPLSVLDKMRPWLAASTLMAVVLEKAGITGEHGIDRHFLRRARGEKPIAELEGVLFQLKLFAAFDDEQQAAFLSYTLEESSHLTRDTQKLLDAWKAGDVVYLEKLLDEVKNTPDTRPIYDVLFRDRNRAMAKKLEGYLKTGKTHFVIVGAAHLVGAEGLPSLMRKRGHTVTRPAD